MARYRPRGGVDGARVRWRTKQGIERIVLIYSQVVEEPGGAYFDTSVIDVGSSPGRGAGFHGLR